MELLLSDLAERLGLELKGEDRPVNGVNTLEHAGPQEISFLASSKYLDQLASCRAAAVILTADMADRVTTALVSDNPYLHFARSVQLFARPQGSFTGQSDLAFVHPEATVADDVTIYPNVFVGRGVSVGSGTVLFSGVYLGEDSVVGAGCTLYPNVVVMSSSAIGNNVIIHGGAVIGSDGFGFAEAVAGREKIPQIGRVIIEDDVEIGAATTIDRAALGETRIGKGTKIDNLVQIGHNVQVGENSVIVAQVGIAGSAKLGRNVILAGQVGVAGHLEIGDNCRVGAKSGVAKSIPAGTDIIGFPPMKGRQYLRYATVAPKLPEMHRQLKALEKQVAELRSKLEQGDRTS